MHTGVFAYGNKTAQGEAKEVIERCGDIPVYTAEFDVLTQLTGFKLTRGMLCAMRRPALPDIVDVCKNARRIAVHGNVVNPTNIGAIFRSAAALGMDAVLLSGFAGQKTGTLSGSGLWKRDHSDPDGSKDRGKTFYRTGDPAGECGYGETQRGVERATGSDRHRRR